MHAKELTVAAVPNDSGAEKRALYIDAIEAATRVKGQRGYASFGRNLAEDVLIRQLKQAEQIRKRLDKAMRQAIAADEDWIPDVNFVTASAKNTEAIAKSLGALRAIRKDAKEARRGMTNDELDAVFIHQLRRVAVTMTTPQWRELLGAAFGLDVADAVLKARES